VATGLAAGPTIDDPSQALLPATGPAHPIVGEIGRSATVTVLVLVAGAVAAPVVEEIFFRGCLHGHVRSGLRWLGSAAPLAAALVTAFVFAAIHPQGWIAVPALMSLAVGFSLVREWRGSVVAPIVMHAINNGAVLTGLSLMLA
jgi:membrane protease YdiL (CAAX protease family)